MCIINIIIFIIIKSIKIKNTIINIINIIIIKKNNRFDLDGRITNYY